MSADFCWLMHKRGAFLADSSFHSTKFLYSLYPVNGFTWQPLFRRKSVSLAWPSFSRHGWAQTSLELSTLDLVFLRKNSIFVMRTYNIYKYDIFWIYQTLPRRDICNKFHSVSEIQRRVRLPEMWLCAFHHVSVIHLQQYVDEFCFRLNNKDCNAAFLKCAGLAVA